MATLEWDVPLTRQLLLRKLGKRYPATSDSLFSILDRLSHARYHYHKVAGPWAAIMERARSADERWRILGWRDDDDEESHRREEERIERSANLVACVQALHAIPDTLAFMLFYCLDVSLPPKRYESDVSIKNLIAWLANHSDAGPFVDLLTKLIAPPTYSHLEALSNHAKHRSIVSDTMLADATGTDTVPLRLRFRAFAFKGNNYASVDALPLLQQEFDRINPLILECGALLNAYLNARPDRARSA